MPQQQEIPLPFRAEFEVVIMIAVVTAIEYRMTKFSSWGADRVALPRKLQTRPSLAVVAEQQQKLKITRLLLLVNGATVILRDYLSSSK
jgi:hypothetical protein